VGAAIQRWERLLRHVTQKVDAVVHTKVVSFVKKLVSVRTTLAGEHDLRVW
jgi:hypothetical protein